MVEYHARHAMPCGQMPRQVVVAEPQRGDQREHAESKRLVRFPRRDANAHHAKVEAVAREIEDRDGQRDEPAREQHKRQRSPRTRVGGQDLEQGRPKLQMKCRVL